jgi:predicted nucleotidyltransferase component of viral defense system
MIDYLRQQIQGVQDNNLSRCLVREYLQARLLESLQDNGAFASWAFVGGTALRFLYSMPRFSEDLDFSLSKPGGEDRFEELLKKARVLFETEGYSISIKAKTDRTVKSAMVKFEGLLYDLELSPMASEMISIKVEIDTNPPAGANLETSIIRRHCLLNLQHYDKASLLAGKLHALLVRTYTKGRDVYDLLWYLSDRTWPEPNLLMLNNALEQTGWEGESLTAGNWRPLVAGRLADFDWPKIIADVQPFIERQRDLALLTNKSLQTALLE